MKVSIKSLYNGLRLVGIVSWAAASSKMAGKRTRAVVVPWSEGYIAVDPSDAGVGRQLRRSGEYEPEERDRVLGLIQPGARVLVVGAHIGAMTLPLSRVSKEVVAVEANPTTRELLEINIRISSSANIEVVPYAASDVDGAIEFILSKANSGGSKRRPVVDSSYYTYDRPEVISVEARRLDELISNPQFDLILMDVEGSEVPALKGMKDILRLSSSLVVEFLPHHLRNVMGVDVSAFLDAVGEFDHLFIPSRGVQGTVKQMEAILQEMFLNDEGDAGLIFSKAKLSKG